jgi:hypothetical protein
MALLAGSATSTGAQTEAPAELTPLGKRLLKVAVHGETVRVGGATGVVPGVTVEIFVEGRESSPYSTCAFPGGLCGVVNRDGRVLLAPQFDWVDDFHEGRALVRLRGLYGVVDNTGHVIVEPQYELASHYKRGYAQVVVGDKMGLIDRDGRFAVEPRFGYVDVFGADTFWASAERTACEHIRRWEGGGVTLSFCGRGSRSSFSIARDSELTGPISLSSDRLSDPVSRHLTPAILRLLRPGPKPVSGSFAPTGRGP